MDIPTAIQGQILFGARFAGETATLHRRTDEKGLFTIGYKNDVAKFTPKSAKQCKTRAIPVL
jgi:ABC-type phosphate transport system permease subunit